MKTKTSLWILGMASWIGLASFALAACPSTALADDLQKWIAGHAVAVRTIDAADEDFRDLNPLIDAIGTARVV